MCVWGGGGIMACGIECPPKYRKTSKNNKCHREEDTLDPVTYILCNIVHS